MSKRPLSELASIAEIVAAVAVVISLLFVGMQVYDNTAVIRASQSNELYDAMREIDLTVLSHPHLTVAVEKGLGGRRAEMSEGEVAYFRSYISQIFNVWESAYYRTGDDMMSSENYLSWEANFTEYLRRGVTGEDLDEVLPWYSAEFRARVSAIAETLGE